MNDEEKEHKAETHFRIVDSSVEDVCNEYELCCNNQIDRLSDLGGPLNLGKFGMFRSFFQTLIDKMRDKVINTRKGAMRSAFKAVGYKYFDEFIKPVPATIIFGDREYALQMKAVRKQKVTLEKSWKFWTDKIFDTSDNIEALQFIKEVDCLE